MNDMLKMQINAMQIALKNFEQSCDLATIQDDGKTSIQEKIELKKIKKASEKMYKALAELK